MSSEISSSGKGGKNTPKNTSPETKKKQKNTDLTRRGKSNVLAHSPFIRVFTVVLGMGSYPHRC